MQNIILVLVLFGDEGLVRKVKVKLVKCGRKWDVDGFVDEDDGVQFDYLVFIFISDSEVEFGVRLGVVEEVDVLIWGFQIKGKFVLRDLGDEVNLILVDVDVKKNVVIKIDVFSGFVGIGFSVIGGLFRNVVGGKVLIK